MISKLMYIIYHNYSPFLLLFLLIFEIGKELHDYHETNYRLHFIQIFFVKWDRNPVTTQPLDNLVGSFLTIDSLLYGLY